MKAITSTTLLCLVLVSGAVVAAESGKPLRPGPDQQQRQQRAEQAKARWNQADTNHDGSLSREEAQQGMPKLAQYFDKLDKNNDGQLTPDELRAAYEARKGDRPARNRPQPPQN
jgi:EF-hand domain/EF hand